MKLKKEQEAIDKTKKYINNISLIGKRRRYNLALNDIVKIQESASLQEVKNKIFEYISQNENRLDDIEKYLIEIVIFYRNFDDRFTDDMKTIQCIILYYFYESGGSL